jgi:hypothetical protein
MSDNEGTDTLRIRLEDDASDPANAAATALERLAKSQDEQAKAGIGGPAGEKQATAFKRLREMGTQAGSALAAAMAGVQVQMGGAVTATNRLSSALQLAQNRAREARAADGRQLAEDMTRANKTPLHLQASPPKIDMAAAMAKASGESGSAQRAAASGVLDQAVDAAKAEAGGKKLASVYDLVARRAANAAKEEEKAFAVAVDKANKLPKSLQPKAAPPEFSGLEKLLGTVRGVFGDKAAGGVAAGAAKLAEVDESMGGKLLPALGAAAGVYGAAGAMLAAAALALVTASVKVLVKVGEMSIEQTTFREGAQSALDRLTKGSGAATYDATLKIAAKLGIDKNDAINQTKALLQAGLDKETIPLAIQAIADISVDLGDEKGNALKEKLAQFGHGKKIDAGAITGLAEAGVDANKVFEALKQKGESLDHVMARLKTNQVGSAEAIKAVLAAVESSSGGAAEGKAKSIPGLLNAISIAYEHLFDSANNAPVKDALGNVYKVISGPGGDKLRDALGKLGSQLFKTLLGPFEGAEGQKRLEIFVTRVTELATSATSTLKTLAPYVESFVEVMLAFAGADMSASDNGAARTITAIADVARAAIHPIDTVLSLLKQLGDAEIRLLGIQPGSLAGSVGTLDTGSMALDAGAGGQAAGENLASGFKIGILSGTAGAVSAAIDMAKAALAGVASPAGQDSHSPSKKAAALGGYFSQGYAIQIQNGGDAANDAGAALAMRAVTGTAKQQTPDVGPLAPSGGGSNGPGPVTIQVTIQAGPGTTPDQARELGDAAGAGAAAAWDRQFSRKMRDIKRSVG